MSRTSFLLPPLLGCTLAACAQAHESTAQTPSTTATPQLSSADKARLFDALVDGANRSEALRAQAAQRPSNELLAALIENELPANTPRQALSPAQRRDLEQRLGVALPQALASLLETPGAWQAMGWTDPNEIVTAESLGAAFVAEIEAAGPNWRKQAVALMDQDSDEFRVPAGDLAHYLVVSRRPDFGNLILYDPSPNPKHPRCVLIETTLFDDHLHSGYASLREYVESEWAVGEALLK